MQSIYLKITILFVLCKYDNMINIILYRKNYVHTVWFIIVLFHFYHEPLKQELKDKLVKLKMNTIISISADQFCNIRTGNESDCTNAIGIIASSNADSQGNL